jgi:drug/metabolite transporter (DMT)-like permease
MIPILVMLGSSLGWAAFDALRKALVKQSRSVPLTAALALGQLPFFVAWMLFSRGYQEFAVSYLGWGLLSVSINVSASVLFIKSLELSPLSTTIPFLAFIPVFTVLSSAALLGEVPTLLQFAGIVLVVLGALLLNLRIADTAAPQAVVRAVVRERGSLLMMAVALLWSFGAAVDKRALVHAHPSIHAAVQCAGIAFVLLLYLSSRNQVVLLRDIGKSRVVYVLALVAGSIGLGLQLVAIRLVLVSIVESVKRAVGMTLAVVNGRFFFGEPVTIGKIAGILSMSLGVALILL